MPFKLFNRSNMTETASETPVLPESTPPKDTRWNRYGRKVVAGFIGVLALVGTTACDALNPYDKTTQAAHGNNPRPVDRTPEFISNYGSENYNKFRNTEQIGMRQLVDYTVNDTYGEDYGERRTERFGDKGTGGIAYTRLLNSTAAQAVEQSGVDGMQIRTTIYEDGRVIGQAGRFSSDPEHSINDTLLDGVEYEARIAFDGPNRNPAADILEGTAPLDNSVFMLALDSPDTFTAVQMRTVRNGVDVSRISSDLKATIPDPNDWNRTITLPGAATGNLWAPVRVYDGARTVTLTPQDPLTQDWYDDELVSYGQPIELAAAQAAA
jgi:hypothetical protein